MYKNNCFKSKRKIIECNKKNLGKKVKQILKHIVATLNKIFTFNLNNKLRSNTVAVWRASFARGSQSGTANYFPPFPSPINASGF